MTTVAVLSGPERRRRWTSAEKGRIVEESLTSEASVVEVARRHDIHHNLLHLWRRQARAGIMAATGQAGAVRAEAVRFAAVAVASNERVSAAPPGMIEIEFASGARLRITGLVDAATASAAIAAVVRSERRR
jgi:transposase